ncbi:hypothetical protein [Mesorhizobium sp. M00.F.Ca.ET.217.01.1.1]|uniref:hypothetical protein n=1 Tax=Mesorhizobium sp. M00.F.Ca.ET.217.01.1.1 TaxID=2500529 RepID=UPI000FDA9BC9|nr:hypothetical protein [Mesorhizobium sp. M00.F.Ca.ET.217.01.1.1]TGQ19296.1 hypothetical protein EN860_019385 [Mesorhizobium sp. M00.F.Ca.ET.217.01.1.1]
MSEDYHKFCRINYWKRNGDGFLSYASKDDDWTEVVVAPLSTYSGYGEQRMVRESNTEYNLRALVDLLRQAYEAGQRDKLRHIQRTLGIAS